MSLRSRRDCQALNKLSETEIKPSHHLLRKMRYSKGLQKGQLLSSYLQDKALLFVEDTLYKDLQKLS
ncbi:2188_t:CDS:2 [Funneliformis geosporum]|uniref:14556_t:CDS:1 n=1 Tax=Funneliformis geosporum TaxID=1117311 RepID=A0A9W4WV29_9GLOM|nr:14556_t:CDS:2 [Funneliformis geosporum]CAI2193830.1 2188_t:CDS:2 [Funneliformis geosporum]